MGLASCHCQVLGIKITHSSSLRSSHRTVTSAGVPTAASLSTRKRESAWQLNSASNILDYGLVLPRYRGFRRVSNRRASWVEAACRQLPQKKSPFRRDAALGPREPIRQPSKAWEAVNSLIVAVIGATSAVAALFFWDVLNGWGRSFTSWLLIETVFYFVQCWR